MTSPHPKRDKAPAPAQPLREFAQAWNGYDRNQVRQHLESLQSNMQQLITDRDAAMSQLNGLQKQIDALRAENGKLQSRVEQLQEPPKTLDDLDHRMQRVGQLAYLRADEVAARAQTASEENWKATAKASISLRERYRSLLKELDQHAEALHAEHRAALEETRAEVKELMVDAVRRRDALDAEAERKRRAIEREFDATMAAQRKEADKHLADQRTAAKQKAERSMAQAQAQARRTISEGNQQAQRRTAEANKVIDRLLAITKDAHGRLDAADRILAGAEKAIEPSEDEQQKVPRAEDAVPAPDAPAQQRRNAKPANGKPTVKPSKPQPQPAGAKGHTAR